MPSYLFAYPWAFWSLAVLPVLGLLALLAARRRRKAIRRLGSLAAVLALTTRRGGTRVLRGVCLFAGLFCLGVGTTGPQWGRDWTQAIATGRDVVVLLDVSRSMLAHDVLPSRQERAQQALRELSRAFQKRGGNRLALVVFAAHAQIVCPLTHDYDHFRQALSEQDAAHVPLKLRPSPDGPTSGTRIGAGLKMAIQAHRSGLPAPGIILLLSDGDDPARDEEWRAGALEAKKQQIPVFTIGIGDPAPKFPIRIPLEDDYVRRPDGKRVETRLEEDPLREIAHLTRGTYHREGTNGLKLGELFQEAIQPQAMRTPAPAAFPSYVQRYPWFFGAALVLLSASMMIGHQRPVREAPPTRIGKRGSLAHEQKPSCGQTVMLAPQARELHEQTIS